MRVESDEEEEGEVVSVPKSLEALVTNFAMSGCVNEQHDEEHKVAGDSTSLGVVNVEGGLCADLCRGRGEGQVGGAGDLRVSSTLKKLA